MRDNIQGFYDDNHPRFTEPGAQNHVESYFVRANHATLAQAVWLKATVLKSPRGDLKAELWFIYFDGQSSTTWGQKRSYDLQQASIAGQPLRIEFPEAYFDLAHSAGAAQGEMTGKRGTCSWDLNWECDESFLASPLCLLPSRRLIEGSFPKNKLLSPSPSLRFTGQLNIEGKFIHLDNWVGMQGHNWGRRHSPEYAWGHCLFLDPFDSSVFAMVEAFSGRTQVGGFNSPMISAMVVRHGEHVYRFDRLFDLWKQKAELNFPHWSLAMSGADGQALLKMSANPSEVACLGYENPDDALSYCLNSKLAQVHLRVNPKFGEAFECKSSHGGALEFLGNDHPATVGEVI